MTPHLTGPRKWALAAFAATLTLGTLAVVTPTAGASSPAPSAVATASAAPSLTVNVGTSTTALTQAANSAKAGTVIRVHRTAAVAIPAATGGAATNTCLVAGSAPVKNPDKGNAPGFSEPIFYIGKANARAFLYDINSRAVSSSVVEQLSCSQGHVTITDSTLVDIQSTFQQGPGGQYMRTFTFSTASNAQLIMGEFSTGQPVNGTRDFPITRPSWVANGRNYYKFTVNAPTVLTDGTDNGVTLYFRVPGVTSMITTGAVTAVDVQNYWNQQKVDPFTSRRSWALAG